MTIDDPLVGEYFASGNNPDGTTYSGKVIISPQGDSYLVTWYVADDHFEADGIREGDVFAVRGDFDFEYQIKESGILSGEWEKDAFEELTKIHRDEKQV